jgi:hypothetical protein
MWKHPEQGEHEVYLMNADDYGYGSIGWKTKRQGLVAYDIDLKPVREAGIFPVFVSIAEMEEAGVDTSDIWENAKREEG